MWARAEAVPELEKAVSHDWRRLVVGAASLGLVLIGELGLVVVVKAAADVGWEPAAFVLIVAAVLALVGGGVLGVRTWRWGRRLVSALVAWEELTDRVPPDGSDVPFKLREVEDAQSDDELRHIWWRNWVWFRTRPITFARGGRILIGTLLLLGGGGLVVGAVGVSLERGQLTYLDVVGAVLSLTVALYGLVVLGGQGRFGMALTRREFRMRREWRAARST
ncbi:MAG: hypothetical protein ACRDTD_22610 [Pseudonocardiaceae bacterium]